MSCTVIAIPYAIAWVVGAVATAAAGSIAESIEKNKNTDTASYYKQSVDCDDVHTITTEHFIEKDFETPFVDKDILIKTLEEHGVTNIADSPNYVGGTVDNYTLNFSRNSETEPFTVRISAKENNNAEEKMNDLSGEYALNVQEDAYLHIIDKLKENNMQIEEEVVEDDNTIVLTVNIE